MTTITTIITTSITLLLLLLILFFLLSIIIIAYAGLVDCDKGIPFRNVPPSGQSGARPAMSYDSQEF